MKSLLWFVEIFLLGFSFNSFADGLHGTELNDPSEEEPHHFELPAKPDVPFRKRNIVGVIGPNFVGRQSTGPEAVRNPTATTEVYEGKIIQRQECYGIQTDQGKVLTLVGPIGNIKVGERVRLTGAPVDQMNRTICMEGDILAVRDINRVE